MVHRSGNLSDRSHLLRYYISYSIFS
jgi:hypothetical protein